MRNELKIAAAAFCCAAAGVVFACSSELDITEDSLNIGITVGGDSLALPVGTTDSVTLADFLNVGSSEVVHLDENGNYYIETQSAFEREVSVSDYASRLTVPGIDKQCGDRDFTVPQGKLPEADGVTVRADYDYDDEFTYKFSFEEARDSGVVSLKEVYLEDTYMVPHISITSDKTLPSTMRVALQVEVPDKYVFKESEYVDGNLVTFEGPVRADGSVDIAPLEMEALILNVKEGDDFAFEDVFYVRQFSIIVDYGEMADFEGADVHVATRVTAGAEDGSLHPSSFLGKVDININPIENESLLTGIPSYLMSDDVYLDFTSPSVRFKLETNAAVPLLVDASVEPVYDGVTDNAFEFTIPAPVAENGTASALYWLSDEQPASLSPGYEWIEAGLRDLISRIPDRIRYVVAPRSDMSVEEDYLVDCHADYVFDGDMTFNLPLAFGDSLYIPVRDTLTGLPDELATALSTSGVEVRGEVISTFPVDINIGAVFLDSYGNPADVEVIPQYISGAGADGAPVTSPLTLKVESTGEVLDVASVVVVFELLPGEVPGVQISDDAWIQASLALSVPGGITLELGDNE
ncbi:MAG TPA: hypothetical protein IAC04_05060 [Candidatus Coprenecus stercoravium]|uniref:DUF4493 domain-containing protein n=1 Tax=Candidatus Coprenecus stercoravium TaxID=2840735 RepID=A0A9D2GRW0_9BACT|nr:hypothetical protein [Candidatus Coprenecus stercoravium]